MLIAVLAAACSTGLFPGTRTDSFRDRLALLPASVIGEPLIVAMADLDRAAQLAGVERPADASDVDAVTDYVQAVTGLTGSGAAEPPRVAALTPETVHVDRVALVNEFDDELGWSIADVSWFAEVQVPPNTLMVAGGDFDEARLTAAMGDRQDGVWRLGGEDGEIDFAGVTAARPVGESLRLALGDGRLIVGRSTPPVAEALEGGGATLADNAVLAALAEAMDGQDAYSALFFAGPLDSDPQAAPADPEDEVLPQPFRGVAGGLTSADGAPIVLLAYVHDSAEAAQANADALGRLVAEGHSLVTDRAWSTYFTVDDIQTDGSTVVARLRPAERQNPRIVYDLMMSRDSLVTHG